jgi:ParB family transcriptional regulator, chromosome partitioning protein
MDMRKRGLGRGLGALIPGATAVADHGRGNGAAETSAPIGSITANPYQPRGSFEEGPIEELAASIREKGVLQPLLVRRVAGGYQLIAGERRFRAAQRAGLAEVPIVVRDADDNEALELALIENVQRENLNPIEEARGYLRLSDEFGLAQEEIARRVGKSRSAVTNMIRLLQLPADIVAQIESGQLTAGHARSLLALESAQAQKALARDVVAQQLSVRDTERRVRERAAAPKVAEIERRAVETDLARALGTRVHLKHNRDGSGRIVVEYYSLDELDGLIDRLGARR